MRISCPGTRTAVERAFVAARDTDGAKGKIALRAGRRYGRCLWCARVVRAILGRSGTARARNHYADVKP